jgi:hypothetical protein
LESNRCSDIRQKLSEQFFVSAHLYSEAVVHLTRFQGLTQAEYAKLCEARKRRSAQKRRARNLKSASNGIVAASLLIELRAAHGLR